MASLGEMPTSLRGLACASVVFAIVCAACKDPEPSQRASRPTDGSAGSASVAAATPKQPALERVELKAAAMGTSVVLIAHSTDQLDAGETRAALQRAHSEILRLERLMSEWRPDSEVSRINQRAGDAVPVSPETFDVLAKSRWAGDLSSGTFDVTFGSVGELWKFGDAAENPPKVPTPAEVKQRLRYVDYRRLLLDDRARTAKIPEHFKLGLGGIAKGYAVDRAAAVLRGAGLTSFLVQAGGDLYGAGTKPDGSPWVSGIQDPRGPKDSFFAVLELRDRAFSTAGDYARSYTVAGRRYHHIIDPRTGYPATASRSVTVWAPDALVADAIDDAVFILGPEKGLALVESMEGAGAVIVDHENKVWVSSRLRGKVKLLRDPSNRP